MDHQWHNPLVKRKTKNSEITQVSKTKTIIHQGQRPEHKAAVFVEDWTNEERRLLYECGAFNRLDEMISISSQRHLVEKSRTTRLHHGDLFVFDNSPVWLSNRRFVLVRDSLVEAEYKSVVDCFRWPTWPLSYWEDVRNAGGQSDHVFTRMPLYDGRFERDRCH